MALLYLLLAAVISSTLGAPWRCYKTAAGDTICFGMPSEPSIKSAEVCIERLALPCSMPATVCTPPLYRADAQLFDPCPPLPYPY